MLAGWHVEEWGAILDTGGQLIVNGIGIEWVQMQQQLIGLYQWTQCIVKGRHNSTSKVMDGWMDEGMYLKSPNQPICRS